MNTSSEVRLCAEFVPGAQGPLMCVDVVPAGTPRGVVLFVHGWAEEVAKSRHLVAQASRAMAREGILVRALDLYGCGDSAGDLSESRWEVWAQDLLQTVKELERRHATVCHLWGLRSGALLAVETLCALPSENRTVMLWQPLVRGRLLVNEFLRIRVAASMMGAGPRETLERLRQQLEERGDLEVAGYRVTRALAESFDSRSLCQPPPGTRAHWFDISGTPERPLSGAVAKALEGWELAGVDTTVHRVSGPPFWGSGELQFCDELVRETARTAKDLVG